MQEDAAVLQQHLQTSAPLKVACIAGGPCSAALGFCLWHQQQTANLNVQQEVQCHVYDFESGWAETAPIVNEAMQAIYPQASIQWEQTCDLLKGLDHTANHALNQDLLHQKVLLFVLSCTCLKASGRAAEAPGSFFATLLECLRVDTFVFFIESHCNVPQAFEEMETNDKKLKFCGTINYPGLAGIYLYRVVERD